ncbi:MAG: DNA cytosine methyltransferase [Chitinophagales bacterium]
MSAAGFPFIEEFTIDKEVELIIIDLFCGAGGTSTGFMKSMLDGKKICRVVACVNHDPIAILSHWRNHPEVFHFEEDIRLMDFIKLKGIVDAARKRYPNAKVILWASLECTNFSKAKGGMAREADSRTLAESLYKLYNPVTKKYYDGKSYIQILDPDYIMIENVVEFMSWGPLDEKGKPISRKNGTDFMKWRENVKEFGYNDDWKQLNSADFGAHTSRNRLFGIFAKKGLPIIWPQATHAKNPKVGLYKNQNLKKYRPVKEVLNFKEEGKSIFDILHDKCYKSAIKYLSIKKEKKASSKGKEAPPRTIVVFPASIEKPEFGMQPMLVITEKQVDQFDTRLQEYLELHNLTIDQVKYYRYDPYSEKTLERIYAGLIKFVAGGKAEFLLKYNSVNGKTGKYVPPSVDDPCPVVSTQGRINLVQASYFLSRYYTGNPEQRNSSVNNPCGTVTTNNRFALVHTKFIMQRNSGDPKSKVVSVDEPARTLTSTGGNQHVVQPFFITKYFSGRPDGKNISVDQPAGVIKTVDSQALVETKFLAAYYGSGENVSSVNSPCPVLPTKDRFNLVYPKFFIYREFKSATNSSIDEPCGTITTIPKLGLVKCEPFILNTNYNNIGTSTYEPCPTLMASKRHYYLMNPQWFNKSNASVDEPCFTLIARMDKAPPYLVSTEDGNVAIVIYESDSHYLKLIKEFMALYGIIDIKMRMLLISELKKIQGFPESYILEGNQTDQKKFIGNSVCPKVPKVMAEALGAKLREIRLQQAV